MDSNNRRLAIRFGIIAGLVFTVLFFGFWAAGIKSFAGFLFWYTFIPVNLIIILIGAFQGRKQLGGYMSFKECLSFAFLAYVVFEVFYAIDTLILFRFIDPKLAAKVFDHTVESMRVFLERFGAPESQIEESIEKMRASSEGSYTFGQILVGFGTSLIWDFVKSLIIALIVQRKRPEFADFKETNT